MMTIDQGNRFSGIWSNVGLLIVVLSFCGLMMLNRDFFQPLSLLLVPLGIIGIDLLRNRRGLELDKQTSQVRAYQKILGFKVGNWESLEAFDRVILIKDYFLLNVGPSTVPFLRGRKKRMASFDVLLADGKGNDLVVNECTTHAEAKKHLKNISAYLELPAEDRLQETIDRLQKRRKSMRRR